MGSQMDKKDAIEDAWGDKVVARLTGPSSAFYVNPNEHDPVKIEESVSDLRAQHQNYIDNHSDRYKPGTHAYDSIAERIEEGGRQLEASHKFVLDYQNIQALNDKSTELRPVPVTDNFGNVLYERNTDGSIAVDVDGNQIERITMENDWTEMQSLIFNSSADELGRVMFPARVYELRDSILDRNIAVGTALYNFQNE